MNKEFATISDVAIIADKEYAPGELPIGTIGLDHDRMLLLTWNGQAWYTCQEYSDWLEDAAND